MDDERNRAPDELNLDDLRARENWPVDDEGDPNPGLGILVVIGLAAILWGLLAGTVSLAYYGIEELLEPVIEYLFSEGEER